MGSVVETREAHTFLERTMPLLTHFQICEGLDAVSIDEKTQISLKLFAESKLEEITQYIKESSPLPARLGNFRKRIEGMADYLVD